MMDVPHGISPEDYQALERAYTALEHPSYAARLSSLLGAPIEQALRLLPDGWQERVNGAARGAVARAVDVAATTLGDRQQSRSIAPHRLLAAGSGAIGGYFGVAGLVAELPVSTLLMLRAIADIARRHGEDLASPETRLACVAVFAYGGRTHEDDYAEIGYYEVRAALAMRLSNVVGRALGVGAQNLPVTVELVRFIARRFGVVISDKVAVQFVPVVGAATGAAINTIFVNHFQSVAHGHFTIRHLERSYGAETIEAAYAAMARDEDATELKAGPKRATP